MGTSGCFSKVRLHPRDMDEIGCPLIGKAKTFHRGVVMYYSVRWALYEHVQIKSPFGRCKKEVALCRQCNRCLPLPAKEEGL